MDIASEVKRIVAYLDTAMAEDSDLIFWDHIAGLHNGSGLWDCVVLMFTFYRVETLVVPEVGGARFKATDRLDTMCLLALSTFCQRLVNANDADVKSAIDLEKLMDLPSTLMSGLHYDNARSLENISNMLMGVIRSLKPAAVAARMQYIRRPEHVLGMAAFLQIASMA